MVITHKLIHEEPLSGKCKPTVVDNRYNLQETLCVNLYDRFNVSHVDADWPMQTAASALNTQLDRIYAIRPDGITGQLTAALNDIRYNPVSVLHDITIMSLDWAHWTRRKVTW